MLHPISQSVFKLIIMMMLIGTPAFIEAAQAARTKAQKAPAAKEDPGPWLLAGRDGECVPLSILSKKGPEYSDIQSPHQLAEKLRAAGHEAEIKEFNAGTRPAVEVRAPSAGLDVMFIKKDLCDKPPPTAENK
ncbi:MAG TPA: hypothetical protein VN826_00375 [Candidatus Eisenbacteria bacterium]|jgi:hypothetical protein|nr:hypothetical protein [Candidatus Eisenbacteria bacterium]